MFIPVWLYILAPMIQTPEFQVDIPYSKLIGSLVTLIAVLLFGVLLHYKPQLSNFLNKVLRAGGFLFVVMLLTFGLYASR